MKFIVLILAVLVFTPIQSHADSLNPKKAGVEALERIAQGQRAQRIATQSIRQTTRYADDVPAGSFGSVGSADNAKSAADAVRLQKQLASEQQIAQLSSGRGSVISHPADQARGISRQTGRQAEDIQKVSSSSKVTKDGQTIQTHAFRDASDNALIKPKTIVEN